MSLDKTRQELLLIMDIQAEEYQRLLDESGRRIAELEAASLHLINACSMYGVGDLEEVANLYELTKEQGE